MKKFLLSLCLALPLCSFAQKGMQGIGLGIEGGWGTNPDVGNSITSYGASFKYEYNLTDRIRLSANLNVMSVEGVYNHRYYDPIVRENPNTPNRPYLLNNDEVVYEVIDSFTEKEYDMPKPTTTFGIDFHYFLNKIRRVRPYLLLGGIIGCTYDDQQDENGNIDLAFGTRLGLGLNWRLGYNCSLQLELPIKWVYMGWTSYYNKTEAQSIRYFGYSPSSDNIVLYYTGDICHGISVHRYNKNEKKYILFDDYYEYLSINQCFYNVGNTNIDHFSLTFSPTISVVYTF